MPRKVTPKQLAANRANAARSTGPRTPQGKAASAQNARKHGFAAGSFTVPLLEEFDEVAELRADLIAVYKPVNSQELFAIERMAVAQLHLLRAARLEAGLFTSCLDRAAAVEPTNLLNTAFGDPDLLMSRDQKRNYALAEGFHRMAESSTWKLFLRYQAQNERLYRRAAEEFDRLKALRPEFAKTPNEPIFPTQIEPTKPTSPAPNEPIFDPQPPPPQSPNSKGSPSHSTVPVPSPRPSASASRGPLSMHRNPTPSPKELSGPPSQALQRFTGNRIS